MITKQDLQNKIEGSRISKLLERCRFINEKWCEDTKDITHQLEMTIYHINFQRERFNREYLYINSKGNIITYDVAEPILNRIASNKEYFKEHIEYMQTIKNDYNPTWTEEVELGNKLEATIVIKMLKGIIHNIEDKDLKDARHFLSQYAKRILREGGYVYLTSEGLMPERAIKECIQVIDECCSHLE